MEEKEYVVKKGSNNGYALAVIIAAFTGAIAMYLLVYFVLPTGTPNTVINRSEKEVTVTDAGIADAVEKLYDAVVVVNVYKNNALSASGTGFVYKKSDGKAYIITNNHVINSSGATSVKVVFTNGSEEEVKVEGADVYSDLAVLSLDENKASTVAEIGDTSVLRLGDTVFTIGAPLSTDYYWSVTRGVLSGKDRMVEVNLTNSNMSDYVLKVLQTDASINSGNSGGPLANSNGQVIGITNMKLVSSGVEGMGFAIPIEDAVEFADAIISGKSVVRPQLGVGLINLNDTWALYVNRVSVSTELTEGVVVGSIVSGGPSEKSGLQKGDIIIAIDNDKVKNAATLRYYLFKHSVGDTVKVTIERNGKTEEVNVTLTAAN